MTDCDLLHRAICLRPDNLTARLVYADWLEDHGQEARAEFIRVQVEFENWRSICANHDPQRSKCPGCVLRHREHELLWPNWTFPAWSGGVIPGHFCDNLNQVAYPGTPTPTPTPYVVFRNGFVESVTATSAYWLAHGPQIVAATPVRTVILSDKQPYHFRADPRASEIRGWWSESRTHRTEARLDDSNELPNYLFDRLPGQDGERTRGQTYRCKREAIDALSAAAVAWARRQAGLDVRCHTCSPERPGWRQHMIHEHMWIACDKCSGTGWRIADC